MPGLVGILTRKPRSLAEPELRQMLTSLRHSSGYKTGTWIDEGLGIYVGWVVRANAFADGMPLRNGSGDVVLFFSGEEYPEPGIAHRVTAQGPGSAGQGPAYLVSLADDRTFPANLNGRFHGLLVNLARRTATLFNDRYGIHRLYHHQSDDSFYFAAEAKAILAVRQELRRSVSRSLGELVSCGCVLENRTVFEGIHVLPPASAWICRDGAIEQKRVYFHPSEWEQQTVLEPEAYYEAIRDVFSSHLPRYFNGPERIGMSLTGGLDTRMIMAWHKAPSGSLPSYSFGGPFRDCHDVTIARRVARASGQSHQVIPVGEEFLSRFPEYAERTVYLTDGCVDVSFAPDLYVNGLASNIAPVRMTGNYGGEVMRRVRAFKPVAPAPGLFHPDFGSFIREAQTTYNGLIQGHPLSFAVFKQTPWHHYGLQALEQTQLALRSPFLDNDFVRTVFRAPQSVLTSNDLCLRLIADGDPALAQIWTDRGLGWQRRGIGASISRRALDFTFKAEYAYDYGMPQWMAQVDHLLSPLHLERLVLGRHKFKHFRVWYQGPLARYVREILLDSRTLSRPYLERKTLEAMVQGHVNGNRNYTTEIHKVLTLELLHRLLIDTAPTQTAA